ncbi:MAG: copper chaperone PCu(A)C [Gammaproteobacteria bacterium]|nr:copper chaperone PCu(A)C [Gammaproteobacteria bacterium]MBU1625535.1 copper chaperone PCu(A)C [Gammaproteobacteria bacterium]MBU1980795.1 copper chaperone PCu(A)C [Gammaproteobacteria bacterium]
MRKYLFAGLFVLSAAAQADEVMVNEAWTRATAPGQDSAMVQAVITSKQAAQLVGVSCECAKMAELHSMVHEDGMMKMRQVEAIDLPAGEAVDLGAAGYHLMLMGLKQQIKEGNKIQLTLTLRYKDGKTKQVKFRAPAKALNASVDKSMHKQPAAGGHDMGNMHNHMQH